MAGLRAIITIGLSALFLLLAGFPMFAHPSTAYTGIHIRRTGALIQPNVIAVDRDSPAYRAGLRNGDVVSCLSPLDHTIVVWPTFAARAAGYVHGTPIAMCVRREQSWRPIRFYPALSPAAGPIYGNDFIAALRLLEYAIFLISGVALVLGRPGQLTWLFFAFCVASLPALAVDSNYGLLGAPVYAIADALMRLASASSGFLLLFAILVPDDRVRTGWRLVAYWSAWTGTAALCALAVIGFFRTDWYVSRELLMLIGWFFTIATVVVVTARLATMQRSERAVFGWAAFAIIWGVVTNNMRSVAVLPGNAAMIMAMLTVIMPVALMYAILKRHVIDVRFVISRTFVYAALTTVVIGLIGLVDWATSAYLHEARVAMALEAAVTIALGFLLHRTYRWLEYAVDFFLFRRKYEAESYLRRLARTFCFAEREETVDKALVYDPYEKFDLTAAALFRENGSSYTATRCEGWSDIDLPPFDRDHDVVRFLMAERTHLFIGDLHASVSAAFRDRGGTPALAVPVFQGNRLTAFALYGIHRSGTRLDPDEIETLEHLCEIAAQAYTGIELARYQTGSSAAIAMGPA